MINYLLILATFCLSTGALHAVQQNTINGKVVLGDKPMENVRIIIDEGTSINSDAFGIYNAYKTNTSSRPLKVEAYKTGFELANWEYENGNLTIYMREATIRTLKGKLTSNGIALTNQIIQFRGKRNYQVKTDDQGSFTLKIPYSETLNNNSHFTVSGETLTIVGFNEEKDKAILNFQLEKPVDKTNRDLSLVKVIYQKYEPVKNMIVTINGTSYITSDDGTFRAKNVTPDKVNWDFEGVSPLSINASKDSDLITVVLPESAFLSKSNGRNKEGQKGKVKMDSTQIAGVFNSAISQEVNDLLKFYNEQSKEIEIRNLKISKVADSVASSLNLDAESRIELLSQLELLNLSIETTSNDFNELKANSLLLIKRLRSILMEQEEKIREIEAEKVLQARKFRRNLILVLNVLAIASLLLLIAIFIARRINARKKVIERMKNQLSEAQVIAKIASMTYFLKKKQAEYSEQFFDILGIKNEKRIKKIQRTTDHFLHPELLTMKEQERVNLAYQKSIVDMQPFNMELIALSDNDQELYIDLRTKIEMDSSGNPIAISSTLQDVTEKKEKEIQLIKAKKVAEEAGRVKEEFLSTMSHEIRTPLNAILGLTDHLIKNKPQNHQMENLNTLKFSGEHLLTLVNDILDYNKIQAGKIKLENEVFDLKEHISGTSKAMKFISQSKGINLDVDFGSNIPQFVKGDKVRLNQVLTNLLSNGIKFTDKGGVILSLFKEEEKDDAINITFKITDTGIGIASDKLEKIFESFEQEDISTSRKYGGTGLGLSISKQLVDLLGGKLRVKSEQGNGSEFYFTIPFNKVMGSEIKPSPKKEKRLREKDFSKLNILCVEDNEVNQLVISQYFDSYGIKASFAGTGAEAIEKFGKISFDIVFMDIRLPDMQGYEVVDKMREENTDTKAVFIAMTAELNEELKQKIEKSGMIDYLNKPFTEEELKSIISKYGLH